MENKDNTSNIVSKRIIGLDIYRIFLAIIVFLFHSRIHLGCNYGICNNFIDMGAICMTGFFLLSGFVLFSGYNNTNLLKIHNIKKFYLKRLIGIIPMYYLISLIYILICGNENLFENLLLIPIEMLRYSIYFFFFV